MTRPRQTVSVLSVAQLAAHPGNIRDNLGDLEDMARSIREHGILQPLTVTEHPTDPDRHLVIDGHRRLAAALLAHETKAPCIVRHDLDPTEQVVVMLVTGTHRRAVAPIERAKGYAALRDAGLNNSEIARRVGTTPATVTNYLNLLLLKDEHLEQVEAGELPVIDAVNIVREVRQTERVQAGKPMRGRPPVTYFGPKHRLAAQVRGLCSHHDEIQVGSVGCGPCWEAAIVAEAHAPAAVPA